MLRSLTDKQRLFVRAYLIDGNGRKAAIAAGYSPKGAEVQASRMLSHVKVKMALAEARRSMILASGLTPEWVMTQLRDLATGDIRQVVSWTADAVTLINSTELSDVAAAGITEVSQTKSGLKIKRVDRLAILLAIARMLGMGQAPRAAGKLQPPAGSDSPPADKPAADGGWGHLLN